MFSGRFSGNTEIRGFIKPFTVDGYRLQIEKREYHDADKKAKIDGGKAGPGRA